MMKKRRLSISQSIVNEIRDNLKKYDNNLTRQQYLKNFKRFVSFCRDTYDCKTLKECVTYIQDYSDSLQSKGLTASTIHTYLAAVCVLTNVNMSEIKKPIRHTAEYSRGRKKDSVIKSRDLNDLRWAHLVEFQKKVGLRRAELMKLTGKDFLKDESDNCCIRVKGKGGKLQLQLIADEDVEFIKSYFKGKGPNEKIFEKEEFNNNLNLHYLRAECAKEFYIKTVKKLREDKDYEEILIKQIKRRWNKYNLKPDGTPKLFDYKKIDGYYYLRGKNRQAVKEMGGCVKYNKLAVLATSIFKLSHWRCDVTINSYLSINNGGILI